MLTRCTIICGIHLQIWKSTHIFFKRGYSHPTVRDTLLKRHPFPNCPSYLSIAQLNATYRDSPAETVKTEELAGEWSEHFDDEGYAYYYNATSGESQYERPW